jgi:hypothetical protein
MQKKKKPKKPRYSNNKKFSLLDKSSGLIPLVSNPGIGAWYSGLCVGRVLFLLLDRWKDFFFFSTILGVMGCPLQAGALKWSHQVTSL